jgi:hypothetical protein
MAAGSTLSSTTAQSKALQLLLRLISEEFPYVGGKSIDEINMKYNGNANPRSEVIEALDDHEGMLTFKHKVTKAKVVIDVRGLAFFFQHSLMREQNGVELEAPATGAAHCLQQLREAVAAAREVEHDDRVLLDSSLLEAIPLIASCCGLRGVSTLWLLLRRADNGRLLLVPACAGVGARRFCWQLLPSMAVAAEEARVTVPPRTDALKEQRVEWGALVVDALQLLGAGLPAGMEWPAGELGPLAHLAAYEAQLQRLQREGFRESPGEKRMVCG